MSRTHPKRMAEQERARRSGRTRPHRLSARVAGEAVPAVHKSYKQRRANERAALRKEHT